MLELNLPTRFNAAQYFVDRNVDEGRGEQTAILFEDQAYTYRQFLENVNRMANVLTELDIRMEDRVMLLLRDTPEMLFSFYGAIKTGAVPIPSNILMKAPDFLYMLNDSRAAVLIVDAVFFAEVAKILDRAVLLKQVIVCGDADHAHLSFNELLEKATTDFKAAETTPDDTAFWLYSGRNPEKLMGAVHHHSHMVYSICQRYIKHDLRRPRHGVVSLFCLWPGKWGLFSVRRGSHDYTDQSPTQTGTVL
jgi:benzoate-CoA ligase